MFERFTERARQVVVLAQDEARALKHNYIGTEHLGLVRENEGVAAQILLDFGSDANRIRDEVIHMLGGRPSAPRPAPVPRVLSTQRRVPPLVLGWVLGAGTLGAGILVGWLIWG